MKTKGNVTTFDHIRAFEGISAKDLHVGRRLFMVNFDGDWDLWTSQKDYPTEEEVAACIDELKEYYQRDWKGTGREIPIVVTMVSRHTNIDCQ